MIPFTSCMCPARKSIRRRACWLVASQKGADVDVEEGDDVSFCFYPKGSHNRKVDICHYQPWYISKRLTRRPVITPVDDLNFLDHTYSGIAQVLLSKCNHWSFNTFNLDVSTGGRSLPFLLVHLFYEYGFINYFKLDVVKVWRCFNLMEAAYHRHNPYHNSVHAADVTQAMHCFLQENKFAENLTPLEAMAAIIAAVGHDLDHPGVTQTFLVATSNHLVNLYHNSSVLENHHWRTTVSCLLESEIFSHVEKDIWFDIQRQIRSLILATDITRQKEFLSRFKGYLSSEVLDMEKTHYRHFALQIALKCADLCNPCRPWSISQRWSYQVCQEFYRQGSFERQLNLPLTPTFDCSRSRIPKIQTDFLQHIVIPLFDTWDRFLKTQLSNTLLRNLRYNYGQWQRKMQQIEGQHRPNNISQEDYLPVIRADFEEKVELSDVQLNVKMPGEKHQQFLPEIPLESYSTEELYPLTTLLSLTSTTSMISLRKACIMSEVQNHLMCPLIMLPLSSSSSLSSSDCPVVCSGPACEPFNLSTEPSSCKGNNDTSDLTTSKSDCKAQAESCLSDMTECNTGLSQDESKCGKVKEIRHCHSASFLSSLTSSKQQKITDFENTEMDAQQPKANNCARRQSEGKNVILTSPNSGFRNTCFQTSISTKNNSTKSSLCSTKSVQKFIAPVKFTASWCWHIRRSLSAERSQQTCHDFDPLFSAHKGSNTCKTCNKNSGRRGSAPAPVVWGKENGSQKSSLGNAEDKLLLGIETEICGSTVRRWSIPLEPISS